MNMKFVLRKHILDALNLKTKENIFAKPVINPCTTLIFTSMTMTKRVNSSFIAAEF